MTLIFITAYLAAPEPVRIAAEPLTEHFGIVPMVTTGEDGSAVYAEHNPFVLIHLPSGRPAHRAGWLLLDLRSLAEDLETLPIDWDDEEIELTADERQLIDAAYARAQLTDDTDTDEDEDDEAAVTVYV